MEITNEFPMLLHVPKKLRALFENINNYRYFLCEGGRGSGKSVAIARILCWIGGERKVRILCTREVQNSIEESVYQLLVDVIKEFELPWDMKKNQLTHLKTGSTIRFKGCREQGAVSLKSMEGIDIVWVEEAQSITKTTLDILVPTIRKKNSLIFFSMNRYIRKDPVFEFAEKRKDCLHININYDDNTFCPDVLKHEADQCRMTNPKDYRHIWLGHPLDTTTEYLFNFDKLDKMETLQAFGDLFVNQSVMSVDFASGGGDLSVASRLTRLSNVHWGLKDQRSWDEPDTNISVGKVINLYGEWQPDILICDAGGLGYPMFIDLSKTIKNIIGFDGSKTDKVTGVAANNRSEAYLTLNDFSNAEWLRCASKATIRDLETIKKVYQKNGLIYIQSKIEAKKKDRVDSQDRGDSLAMGVFAIKHYLGKVDFESRDQPIGQRVRRVNARKSR